MSEKCKYCDYVSKCSRFCEYNSIMCLIHRSFPKIVDKTYEELEKQNQELKQLIKENTVLVEDENGNYQELNINPLKIQQENQELKEQLEVGKEQYNDLVEEKENLQEQLSNSHQIKAQQKEFIEWLEAKIKNYEVPLTDENKKALGYTLPMKGIYKEILSKYKEIVGGNNDQ